MCLLNLHTTPKRHLKLEHFFRKTIPIEKNIRSHDVLNGLNSIKFLEILSSIQISEYFHLFYTVSTQAVYINKKLHTSRRFAMLRAVSKLSTFFLYHINPV